MISRTPVLNWYAWKLGITPVIPKFYYDAFSQEEIIKELSKELDSLCKYANYLGEEQNVSRETINEVADVLNQLQEGGWFETYADQIKAWINDIHNLEQMVAEQIEPVAEELESKLDTAIEQQNETIATFDERVTTNTFRSLASIEKANNTYSGMLMSHRGAQHCYPENTVAAARMAGQLMFDALEFDLHITADEQPVVMHDSAMSSYTNTSGNAETMNLATIQAEPITKGTWTKYVTEALVGTHYIPSLDEMLDEAMKWDFKQVYVECKIQTTWTLERAQKVYDAVKAHNMLDRVTFSSFGRTPLLQFKEIDPSCRTLILLSEPSQSQIELEKGYGIDAVGFPYAAGKDMVNYANSLNMPVLVYSLSGSGSAAEVMTEWNVECFAEDSMVYLGRTGTYNSLDWAGNRYLGSTYLAPTKFARLQGDAKLVLPIEGVPFSNNTSGVSSPGNRPIWYGQVGRLATPIIPLPIGTLIHFTTMSGRYRFAVRTYCDDFTSYNDSGWITNDGNYGVVATTNSSSSGNAWVSIVVSKGDASTNFCELDAIWASSCFEILGKSDFIMASVKDGVASGVGYMMQYSQTRVFSKLIPTANGGIIRFKPIDGVQQSAYVFGANGKRVVDTGFNTYSSQTDYTINNANALYFRYVFGMPDSSAKFTSEAFGKIATAYEQVG